MYFISSNFVLDAKAKAGKEKSIIDDTEFAKQEIFEKFKGTMLHLKDSACHLFLGVYIYDVEFSTVKFKGKYVFLLVLNLSILMLMGSHRMATLVV